MKQVKVIIDTNVLVSGIFFNGPPAHILKAWQDRCFQIVLSEDILNEYRRVIQTLAAKFGHIDFEPILEKLLIESQLVPSYAFESPVCEDPDDDKFLACAMVSSAQAKVFEQEGGFTERLYRVRQQARKNKTPQSTK